MKKTLRVICIALLVIGGLGGCTGKLTGHQYTKDDAVLIYKVVKGGVTTFMTKEEIQEKGLDKVNSVTVSIYKAIKGNDAE